MLTLTDRVSFTALVCTLLVSVSFSNPDITVLLSFKATADHSNSLSSWVNSSDPCVDQWLGVTCNPESGRVTGLVLENLNLTGSVKPLSQLDHLRHLSLKQNRLSSDSLDLSWWPNVKHFYLSHNRFAGKFPDGISSLRRLRRLDLSHNEFSGKIPLTELARLPHLLTLRLESNSFDGELDAVDSYSYTVSDFNVSTNNLSGEIPTWLSRFPATSFAGNKLLCGHPLPYDCPNPTVEKKSGKKRVLLTTISVAAAAVLAAVTVTVAWCCWHRRRNQKKVITCQPCDCAKRHREPRGSQGGPRPRESHDQAGMVVAFEGCSKGIVGVDDLLRASAEMLAKGSVGTTYKVVMDGSDTVVVKRVMEGKLGKEVDWWMRQVLGKLRHANVVSLRAYHRSQNQDLLLLVYDFLPNGSLHHLLHGNRGPGRTPLDWSTRLRLASDSARGIAFLHDNNKAKLFHGHLTTSNIIVDHLGNACIADAGLYQLLCIPLSPHSAYTAPELIMLGNYNTSTSPKKYSQKCDVYSFGVVLLEILTGKIVEEGENSLSLVKWIQSMAREEWMTWEVLDVELLVYKDMGDKIMALMQLALLCLATSPKDRPTMSMVYRMIEDIRTKGVRDRETTSIMDDLITNTLSDASSPNSLSEKHSQIDH